MRDFKEVSKTTGDSKLLIRMMKYIKPHLPQMILSLSLSVITLVIELLPSLLLGWCIGIAIDNSLTNTEKTGYIVLISGVYLFLILVSAFITYHENLILQKLGQKIVTFLRKEVFTHIMGLSINQINEVPVGKLMTRVVNDTNAISDLFTSVIINLVKSILSIVIVAIILLVLDPTLALIVFVTIPLMVIATMLFRIASRKVFRDNKNYSSEINAFLAENLSGIKLTQIFNQEDKKQKEFKVKNSDVRKGFFKQILCFAVYRPSVYLISMIGTLLTLYFGMNHVLDGILAAGMLISFIQYSNRLFSPIEQITDQFNLLQDAFSSAEKIFDVLDTVPEVVDAEDTIYLDDFKGKIEFKNVWFSYTPDEWILRDISFVIEPGKVVAFVGATGSGKSTIINLIVRNWDIQKGEILIDDIPIRKIKLESIRKNIGQMLQDVFLFNDTIWENISIGRPDITIDDARRSGDYVGAGHFIDKLPNGYNYMVQERGNNFSTGQRQLISFARAISYKPKFLILDEATANIDSESEAIIQDSLNRIMKDHTMIIVAHRLATIQHADNIIVIKKGKIVEQGTHQELLENKGIYRSLYDLQKHQSN